MKSTDTVVLTKLAKELFEEFGRVKVQASISPDLEATEARDFCAKVDQIGLQCEKIARRQDETTLSCVAELVYWRNHAKQLSPSLWDAAGLD